MNENIKDITLIHEHMSIDLSNGDLGSDSYALLREELSALYAMGVRRIVDMTNQVMGRNVRLCEQLEKATGIEIVQSTGYYLENRMPVYIYEKSVDEIAQYMIDDLTVGMDGTSKKARVIGEIASDIHQIRRGQKKAFLAAAIAAKETNAPIFTHTSYGTFGYKQVELLTEQGIPPENIVIGHMDLSCDISEMLRVLDTGVTIGIDTIGKEMPPYCKRRMPCGVSPDEFRADAVKAIVEAGYINQLVLSLDICRKEQLHLCGGYGYQHLFTSFLPMLAERGVTERQISGILRDNPDRILLRNVPDGSKQPTTAPCKRPKNAAPEKSIAEPLEGETKYSPTYIYRQIFGTLMREHHQSWPDIRLDELRLLNPDTVGWIRMEGSPINYPVVSGRGNLSYYLTHNFSGEESCHGAVFMNGAGVLGERTTVIGAHHMKDGSMFFALSQLFFPKYYEAHKGLELLLADGLYRAEFFAVHLIHSGDPEPTRTEFSTDGDYESWLTQRKKQSLYDMPLTTSVRDRVLVMTTCIYPDDLDETRGEFAAYAVLRKVGDRSLLPERIEKRGAAPEFLKLINLWHPLPKDYMPELVPVGHGENVDCRCHAALQAMLEDCRAAGGCPFVRSAYRSAEYQQELFDRSVERWLPRTGMDRRLAMGAALYHCAFPGTSEHQLGLAVDLSWEDEDAAEFTDRWMQRNAWRYGFILRYPDGKEEITGILYERWHYRFVGAEAAKEIQRLDLTLEKYLELFYN